MDLARARYAQKVAARPLESLPLSEFIPRLTPRWESPVHLAPMCEAFDRIKRGEQVRLLISTPPQHGKTETELHGIVQLLLCQPEKDHAFITYAADQAEKKSKLCRGYALRAGVNLQDDSRAANYWRTTAGGSVLWSGRHGQITGNPVNGVLVVDDPFSGREEGDSALIRRKVMDVWSDDLVSRLHPGASVIVCHTRWHPDDMIGQLAKVPGWQYVNLPAILDDGTVLWKSKRTVEFFEEKRRVDNIGDYSWWSLYMGAPRPRGNALFRGLTFYERLPETYQVAIGVDLAYTAKSYADYSTAVVLLKHEDRVYVADVRREQVDAPTFAGVLRQLAVQWPGAQFFSYVGGTEKGTVDFLRKLEGVRLRTEPALIDKFARAQPVSAAWNDERVLVPREAPWLRAFSDEVTSFTGVSDKHDDQVDGLAAGYDCLVTRRARSRDAEHFGWS